jgi:7-carboxy-7-deazaguanine synthase
LIRIAEIYRTLQGEGRLTGVESVFVRTSGCNLRCGFCDTPYASWTPEGDQLAVKEVLAEVERLAVSPFATLPADEHHPEGSPLRHIVITGGEPMLFPDLVPLCAELHCRGMHITIETAGTRYLPVRCDLMAVSPKLSNSTPRGDGQEAWRALHERNRAADGVVRRLNAEYDCQFKFVIGTEADCAEVCSYLTGSPEIDRRRVLLMPLGTARDELATVSQWLEPYCRDRGLTFCPRRHIEWFGCCRGT